MGQSHSQELDLLLNELEERGFDPSPEELGRLKLALLSPIQPTFQLDGPVSKALLAAEQFLRGQADVRAVQTAMDSCWEYADQRWPGGSVETKEACAVRAVISVLHGLVTPGDFMDSLSFFLALVNRVQPDQSRQVALIRLLFENWA